MKNPISVVDSSSCSKLADTDLPFILIVHKGESLIETILKCAQAINLKAASLSGLGALENPTIAYYNLNSKEYQNKLFPGDFELTSLNGNLTKAEDEWVAHIHVTLGDEDYRVIGGHLQNAVVSITTEITVIPFQNPIVRKMDADIGLKLISTR